MKTRIWPVLALGFGSLVFLVALSGWMALVRTTSTYTGISTLHDAEHEMERSLSSLRSDISVSAILMRDFLLDSKASVQKTRSELEQRRSSTEVNLRRLQSLVPRQQVPKLDTLRNQVNAYWHSLDPIFEATPPHKASLNFIFLQTEILPRRQAVLNVVAEIEHLSSEAFNQRRVEIDERNSRLGSYVGRTVSISLLVAVAVAGLSIYRISTLEQVAASQNREMQAAEVELRNLSRQLVGAQEEERRALSRDLHDQVGQVLTALRISLGNMQLSVEAAGFRASQEFELSKRLLSQALRSTRELAMGLRPPMLDDLGLEAALQWYTRQHSRISGTPVLLDVHGSLNHLSDAQRTCIYRTVQEALNNVAKHADAKTIAIKISTVAGKTAIEIRDDGIGFDSSNRTAGGLGLLGMRERIEQLQGTVCVISGVGKGTLISVQLPGVEVLN